MCQERFQWAQTLTSSCKRKELNSLLWCLVSLTDSNHLMFQSSVCLFFFFLVVVIYANTPVYPGSSLTSLEVSQNCLRDCLLHVNPQSVQFSSVQLLSHVRLFCHPINCSTPGLPVYHQLPEFTQTHIHRVSDAIQPSYPLLSPSPPASNPSQHQSLFQWVNSSHEVAKVLELQL